MNMTTFLEHVAKSLLSKFGNNLSGLTVVFPGKRASLFLNNALAELSDKPVWAPTYRTISELFADASQYVLCDKIESVCRLHQAYAQAVAGAQSLDQFYSWGEVLLADFDDVDKHLVDARQLFSNIRDIKELDTNDYITPEQEQALKSFFAGFSLEENTLLKEKFLELWNVMYDIYVDFNQRMRADGVLYEGALQRDVVERIRASRLASDDSASSVFLTNHTYVFVGFNVLNEVEKALFDELQHRGQALFYWDYDVSYLKEVAGRTHEAGHFVLENIRRYGNELTDDCFDNFLKPKQLTIAAASSENIQARLLPQWLADNLTKPDVAPDGETYTERQTAVVLCNEQLLQPVLHSLPEDIGQVNVTMGFPLVDTPAFTFVMALVGLHTEGYDVAHRRFRPSHFRAFENHPYARLLGDAWQSEARSGADLLAFASYLMTLIGQKLGDDVLAAEAVFKTFTCLNRLHDLMTGPAPLLAVNNSTVRRLLRSVLAQQSVPFHGEPAVGLQVMGVLETRALDFRHILMLSVGEGFLPKSVADTSFIPYHLKDAFGLTTLRHKIAVYAYYFYRLIQRAERVTFVYNESNAGLRQNEISRFLRQLEAETQMPIRHIQLNVSNQPSLPQPIVVEKTDEIMQTLIRRYDNNGRTDGREVFLSPSALNQYTACPLKFYYRYVRGLKVDITSSEGLDAVLFGNVFHRAAEFLYRDMTSAGPVIRQQDIDNMLEQGALKLDDFVSRAFRKEYFKDSKEEYTGILTIARQVVTTYLRQLLRHDRKLTPFRIIDIENTFTTSIHVQAEGRDMLIRTGGIVDRLDEVADESVEGGRVIRVVDYKTSTLSQKTVPDISRLFTETSQKEQYYFQTILYSVIIADAEHRPVQPILLHITAAGNDNYSPKLKISKSVINDVRQPLSEGEQPLSVVFSDHLAMLIDEIFDRSVPFTQCADRDLCALCEYRLLCGRHRTKNE